MLANKDAHYVYEVALAVLVIKKRTNMWNVLMTELRMCREW